MCMTHTKWRREREKAAVWTPAYDWKEGFLGLAFFFGAGCGGDGVECWCTEGKRYRRMMATTEMWILLDAFNIRHIQHCSTSTHSHTPVIIYIRVESNESVSHTVRIALIVERYLCFVRNKFLFISAICSNEHKFVRSFVRLVVRSVGFFPIVSFFCWLSLLVDIKYTRLLNDEIAPWISEHLNAVGARIVVVALVILFSHTFFCHAYNSHSHINSPLLILKTVEECSATECIASMCVVFSSFFRVYLLFHSHSRISIIIGIYGIICDMCFSLTLEPENFARPSHKQYYMNIIHALIFGVCECWWLNGGSYAIVWHWCVCVWVCLCKANKFANMGFISSSYIFHFY